MRYVAELVFVLALALGVMGCSETSSTGGAAGDGGSGGGSGGSGGEFPCTEQGILDAIAEGGGPHTFDCNGPTTVVRPTPFVIDNDVILDGNGNLVVERGPWWEVRNLGYDAPPVFQVSPGATTEMIGFILSGGGTPGPIVSNEGLLTLRGSEVFGSEWVGILNSGTMVVEGSTVSEIEGYAIRNLGMLTMVGSSVDASGSTVVENSGTLELKVSTLGSYSERSVWNRGTLTATGSTLQGPIWGSGSLSLVNSTIYGGSPVITRYGENPWEKGTVSLTSSTVTRLADAGAAILLGVGSSFETEQSIIDGRCEATEWDQREMTWASKGYNLESPGNTCRLEEDSDLPNIDPYALKLELLSDNGGATETMALGFRSAAIDVVPAASCAVNEDQRGVSRPHGDACDIGAFEWDGPAGEACVPSEGECETSQIDPIEPICEIIVPDQPGACDGTESIANPSTCTASGAAVAYKLTRMQVAPDCDTGFDLDNCNGSSCMPGGLASPDGANGVDNGLGSSAMTWTQAFGADFGDLNQAFHEAICTGAIDIELVVDAGPEEGCALVTVSNAGMQGDPIPMRLSDDGCLSGTLGTIPLRIGDVDGSIENAVVRMTISSQGFSDGILGGTADERTAGAMGEEIAAGGGAVVAQLFDIISPLAGASLVVCDALSLTLEVGGTALPAP